MDRNVPEGTPGEQPSHVGERSRPTGLGWDAPVAASRTSASGFLLDAVRRRPIGQYVLNSLVVVLFLSGAGMFAYPIFTDVYTEQVLQERLEDEFVQFEVDTFEEWEDSVRNQSGAALTKIVIPDIDIETLVVEGTSPAALRAGAGHYPNTPLPGQNGNVAIAGHRTTYGRPFNALDQLPVGAEIWLSTPVGDHLYRVVGEPASPACRPAGNGKGACITTPKDWEVIAPTSGSVLTLTTCHPKGSAAERLVIRAELVESHPSGSWERLAETVA